MQTTLNRLWISDFVGRLRSQRSNLEQHDCKVYSHGTMSLKRFFGILQLFSASTEG